MKIRALLFGAALLALGACSTNPKPKPPENPAPPVAEQCATTGQACGCWDHPPDAQGWLYACCQPGVPGGVVLVQDPAQCIGSQPPPPVDPPAGDVPPVGEPVGQNDMLRLGGPTGYVTNGGREIKPFGVEACCESWAKCPDDQGTPLGTGWPAVSACFIRETAKYGANIWHMRLAPWASRCGDWGNPDCGEPYWVDIGGTYNPDGTFNMKYAGKIRELVWDIQKRGGHVEIVIGDDWWFKGACGKDSTDPNCTKRLPMSEAAVRAWGKTWHPEHDALYKFWVGQLGAFGAVFWATGNEEDLVPGTTSEHLQARVDAIRKYEQLVGGGLAHLIGTGSFKQGISADYQITHENEPVTGPCNGRPCANNERNPESSVDEEADRFRKALEAKQRYDAWRAGAKDPDWEKRLDLYRQIIGGTAPPVGCFAPPQSPEDKWETLGPGTGDRADEIRKGQTNLGSLCKEPKHHSNGDEAIEALAAEMRRLGYCASKHSDSVTIQSENDPTIWEEYHAVAPYDTGCWSQRPQDYPHNRHRYLGVTTPPPVAECPIEVPLVDEILCKLHQPGQGLWDCTPKANGQPILPEGHPNREACERKAMGGYPTYSLSSETLTLMLVDNPMQFRVMGSGSGVVTCTTPNTTKNICKGGDTTVAQGVLVSR